MTIKDIGPEPIVFNIEDETTANKAYRRVAWSGKYLQVTLMAIPVGGEIGLEQHPETDQFLRVEAGTGKVQMGDKKSKLSFTQQVGPDEVILVPAGKWHNVTNVGDEPLKLYSIYAPAHHKPGNVQSTKEIADRDEEEGRDEPAEWSVQPPSTEPDAH